MKRLLLHMCCGPCTLYPVEVLRKEFEPIGYFYNPNIHPYTEFRKRLKAAREVSQVKGLEVVWVTEYHMREFLREVVFREEERCEVCYYLRLKASASLAKEMGIPLFTTTLLFSPYQKHDLVKEIAEFVAKRSGVEFFYYDFREGFRRGQKEAISLGIYRQAYCGCIFSEQERFDKKFRKRRARK